MGIGSPIQRASLDVLHRKRETVDTPEGPGDPRKSVEPPQQRKFAPDEQGGEQVPDGRTTSRVILDDRGSVSGPLNQQNVSIGEAAAIEDPNSGFPEVLAC